VCGLSYRRRSNGPTTLPKHHAYHDPSEIDFARPTQASSVRCWCKDPHRSYHAAGNAAPHAPLCPLRPAPFWCCSLAQEELMLLSQQLNAQQTGRWVSRASMRAHCTLGVRGLGAEHVRYRLPRSTQQDSRLACLLALLGALRLPHAYASIISFGRVASVWS